MNQKILAAFLFTALVYISPAFAAPMTIDGLYVNTFGVNTNQALIFVHGGPGFNSADFEATTATPLADLGYYVVTYDERGQGRSAAAASSEYTYKNYSDDLQKIISTLKITKPVLLGHSHGGPISIQFDQMNPGVAKAVILVSGPVDFLDAMQAMFQNCSARYQAAGKPQFLANLTDNFNRLAAPRQGTSDLIDPLANIFQHALFGCRLYSTANPTADAQRLDQIAAKNPAPTEENSMPGFLVNESYIYRDNFKPVQAHKGRYFGIYGDEDGLFTDATRSRIARAVNEDGKQRFFLVKGSSHSIYLDQPQGFLELVNQIVQGL